MFRRREPTAPYINVGSVLNGRYRLEQQLGQGGAGVIYKAVDEQLGRTVAIKLLTTGAGMAADKLERFRVEARSVARLNHPNIVTLFDYAETRGQPYLVLEYIPGQDLWELDNGYSPELMPFDLILSIMDGILNALTYSHEHGVIHRDLKPENVMITPDNQVKVMDFGLARIQGQSRLTQEGLVAGTASYLAPELALGEAGDSRVDLYAIGVIMYELFTGRRPFSGDDPLTVISQHIHAPVVPPQRYNANIPDAIQAIILKLLAKNPDERYSTAEEVRKALAPHLGQIESGLTEDRTSSIDRSFEDTLSLESSAHRILLDRIAKGKIVGREKELKELKRRWDFVRMGETGIEPLLLISGEAGIGKTRVLREFQVYTNLRDGYVLHGVAREQDSGTPYAIFANALRNYVADQSARVLQHQTPGFIAGEVVKLAPQLAEKIGYIQPNPPLEPEAERVRLLEQVSRFLLNMAQEQPTLLVLDDLHFADPGSLDILETLLRRTSNETSLLIAGAYRDVALSYTNPLNRLTNSMERAKLVHRIPLRRLSLEGIKQMLEALLGDAASDEFASDIYQITEGNPLFVEELIKGLAIDGQLILREGRWTQRDTQRLHIPGSIKSVLGGRLNRVQKTTLELLQLAATIGRSFSLNMLVAASLYDEETIQWVIEESLRFELIEIQKIVDQPSILTNAQIGIEYQFQHALLRETLYEELRPLRRRRLHRKAAMAMEKLAAEGVLSPSPSVIAHHLINSAQDEKAVPYLRQAGEAARKVYANAEAVDYFEQAREILEDIAMELTGSELQTNLMEQFDLVALERNILNLMGKRKRELSALQTALSVAETLDDKERWVETMSRLATYYWQVSDLNKAEEVAYQALEVAQQNNNQQGELQALERIARVYWTWRNPESMTYASKALIIARQLGDRAREGRLIELIGNIYTDTVHDPHRAEIHFTQALEICREVGNRFEEAWTLWGLGRLALFVDDYIKAMEYYEEATTISEAIGSTLQIGWNLYHTGDAWYNLGEYDQAFDSYQQAQVIFEAAQHARGKTHLLISLGLVYMAYDRIEEAQDYLEQAKRQAEDLKDIILMFRSYEALSAFYRLQGEPHLTRAIRLSNRIIKLAGEGGYFEHELLGYYLRGVGFFYRHDFNEAIKSSTIAIEKVEELNYLHSPQISVAEIYYSHSRILAALGQFETARIYLNKAYEETIRKANLITDEKIRSHYLHQLPLNHTIMTKASKEI